MKIDVCFSPALYPVYHNPEAISGNDDDGRRF